MEELIYEQISDIFMISYQMGGEEFLNNYTYFLTGMENPTINYRILIDGDHIKSSRKGNYMDYVKALRFSIKECDLEYKHFLLSMLVTVEKQIKYYEGV